jgi:hypothetical protein
MRRFPLCLGLVVAVAIALPSALAAQDDEAPPTLRLSFYQCDLNEIGPTMEQIESIEVPIWNELVAEGMVMSYGTFVHAWADEWNVGIYTVAESPEAIISATAAFGEAMQERHPDADAGLNQVCPAHRDGFYTLGPSTGDDGEEGADEGGS